MRPAARTYVAVALAALSCASTAAAQQWGSIKGRVVWTGEKVDPPKQIQAQAMPPQWLARGPLLSDALLIDAKSKGVKDVMVWLSAPAGAKMPVHPKLRPVPKEDVVVDQPCCLFEPRVTMMREGQTLVVKNSSTILHNVNMTSGKANAGFNLAVPPGGKLVFGGDKLLKAEEKPLQIACNAHGWMGGYVGVFDHPYFAVTNKDGEFEIKDAPAGKYVIFIRHDKAGWLHTPRERKGNIGGSKGQMIDIPVSGTLDLGKIHLAPQYVK